MTTAFRFRLDPVLRLRHFELRRSLVALGGARRALAEGRARESTAREVRRLEERLARCEAAAAGARLRVEALERLRERALARWRAECERRRQRELDEMATARWARAREAR